MGLKMSMQMGMMASQRANGYSPLRKGWGARIEWFLLGIGQSCSQFAEGFRWSSPGARA
jgi:hypothetical protein